MSEENSRIKLLAYLFVATITISSGFFLLDVFDYVGTISSSEKIDVSIVDITINPLGDELQITLIFGIINPTTYSRITLHCIYYRLFLIMNGREKFIGGNTYFAHAQLIPYNITYYNATLSVPKAKKQYFSTYSLTSELKWRINCFIHFETPIKRYYETVNIYTTSTAPSLLSDGQ